MISGLDQCLVNGSKSDKLIERAVYILPDQFSQSDQIQNIVFENFKLSDDKDVENNDNDNITITRTEKCLTHNCY